MKKRVLCLLAVVLSVCFLCACAKCIDTKTSIVDVTIVDEYYRGMWVQPFFNGKTTTMITHPSIYKITVEYSGVEYVLSGSETYNKYKNRIGEVVKGTLETKTYDDGSIKHDIISLE